MLTIIIQVVWVTVLLATYHFLHVTTKPFWALVASYAFMAIGLLAIEAISRKISKNRAKK